MAQQVKSLPQEDGDLRSSPRIRTGGKSEPASQRCPLTLHHRTRSTHIITHTHTSLILKNSLSER